jgi:hypothetical protein
MRRRQAQEFARKYGLKTPPRRFGEADGKAGRNKLIQALGRKGFDGKVAESMDDAQLAHVADRLGVNEFDPSGNRRMDELSRQGYAPQSQVRRGNDPRFTQHDDADGYDDQDHDALVEQLANAGFDPKYIQDLDDEVLREMCRVRHQDPADASRSVVHQGEARPEARLLDLT